MESIAKEYINRIESAIKITDAVIDIYSDDLRPDQNKKDEFLAIKTKLPESLIFWSGGMSLPEVKILLNELVREDVNYLEIGLYTGSTFISAMYKNNPKSSIAIDVFNEEHILQEFIKNCKDHKINPFTLMRNDSFQLSEEQKKMIHDVNLYFYDGAHDEIDHEKALTEFYDNLSNIFILIVDDWAHLDAVNGTKSAIEKLNFKIHKEWELGYSQQIKSKLNGLCWHNGLYVAVLEKQS